MAKEFIKTERDKDSGSSSYNAHLINQHVGLLDTFDHCSRLLGKSKIAEKIWTAHNYEDECDIVICMCSN